MHPDRIQRLSETIDASPFDLLALNPGPSLRYLIGLDFHLMERPVIGLFAPHQDPVLILPELEQARLAGAAFQGEVFAYGEDEASRRAAFQKAVAILESGPRRVAVEPLRLRLHELRFLEAAAPDWRFESGADLLGSLRLYKSSDEIDAMRVAVDIAQRALHETLPLVRAGMTERELAAELSVQLLRAGSEPDFPFAPIVASGPNSALPHATPTERALQPGDLLILDWGATHAGYISDLTRTFAIGDPPAELMRVHRIVQQANAAGRKAAGPGVPCGEVDRAARALIEEAGYGEYFIHRTGHGIGLEAHEAPFIRADNPRRLEPGMTFTVEPGIYLPGRGGVRIEDDVVVTQDGAESLSTLPRELETIA